MEGVSWRGQVRTIFIADGAGAPVRAVDAVRALPGLGLEGDRYARGAGTWSHRPEPGRQVTLIEWEALEALRRDLGIELAPGAHRRNVVTVGVPLSHLVGRTFRIGEVRLRGTRLCEPCQYLEKLNGVEGLFTALLHRAGLRAEILNPGLLRVGDAVEPVPEPAPAASDR